MLREESFIYTALAGDGVWADPAGVEPDPGPEQRGGKEAPGDRTTRGPRRHHRRFLQHGHVMTSPTSTIPQISDVTDFYFVTFHVGFFFFFFFCCKRKGRFC